MKKIFLTLIAAFLLIGCSSSSATDTQVEPKLVVGKSLKALRLNDQNEQIHTLTQDAQLVIFAFSKDGAHTCNDYFATQESDYLQKHKAAFIADVSAAPSLIRSMFIMPGLKDLKHTVLILDDKSVAAPFRAGMDTEKITIVRLKNGTITNIQAINSKEELIKAIENK